MIRYYTLVWNVHLEMDERKTLTNQSTMIPEKITATFIQL